jgi:hypothetical protein
MDVNDISAHRNAIIWIPSVHKENKGDAQTFEVGATLASAVFRAPKISENLGKSAIFWVIFLYNMKK